MTCIAGMVYDGGVCMAADSMHSNSYEEFDSKIPKIFTRRFRENVYDKKGELIKEKWNELLIGYTTSTRMGQILQYGEMQSEVPALFGAGLPDYNGGDQLKYIFNLVEHFRWLFNDYGFLKETDDGESEGGTFLLGIFNKLFLIQDDFSIIEPRELYEAIGSGAEVAKGALWYACTHEDDLDFDPAEVVFQAVQAATDHCNGVGGTISYLSVKYE